jgi:hypothetical protein
MARIMASAGYRDGKSMRQVRIDLFPAIILALKGEVAFGCLQDLLQDREGPQTGRAEGASREDCRHVI